jgi:hypothetical protein
MMACAAWLRRPTTESHEYTAAAPFLHLGTGAPSPDGMRGPPSQQFGIIGVVIRYSSLALVLLHVAIYIYYGTSGLAEVLHFGLDLASLAIARFAATSTKPSPP